MTDPIQQIADTTEEMEVRRRFASQNARYAFVVFLLGTGVSLITFVAYSMASRPVTSRRMTALSFAALELLAAALCVWYIRNERRGHGETRILRHFSDWLLFLFIVHFAAFMLAASRSYQTTVMWSMLYPAIFIVLHLPFSRRVAAHSILILGSALIFEIHGTEQMRVRLNVQQIVSNALFLAVGGWNSRRLRREVSSDWSERRAQAREQLRMRDELRFARDLQLSMLPEKPPSLPWIEIAAISDPATEVGGDYFDYFPLGDKLAVICGDVAGHGMASGIVISALRAGLTLLKNDLTKPGVVLRRLHEVVAHASRRRMLTTATIVLFDRAGTATVANAGHPPLIVRKADGSVITLELFAPPLGVHLPIQVAERKVPLGRGDVVVLHSDGVYEARNAAGESYGLESLESIVGSMNGDTSVEQIRDAIVADVERFRGEAAQEDDITVVVARIR